MQHIISRGQYLRPRYFLFIIGLLLILAPLYAQAETRTYTENVSLNVDGDENNAMIRAKELAKQQAFRSYLNEVYKDSSTTLTLAGDDQYIKNLEVIESLVSGTFAKELKARIKVTINEEGVRAFLKNQGAVTDKKVERRIIVLLIPGKINSSDDFIVLDNARAELRRSLSAADHTVFDSDDQAIQDVLAGESNYDEIIAHTTRLSEKLADKGEWLVIGKIDVEIIPTGNVHVYRVLMTGKALSLTNHEIVWEGSADGSAKASKSEARAALRLSAINSGKALSQEILGVLNTREQRGSLVEVVFAANSDYNLEHKILKLLKEEIKGVKNINQKSRGKGDMAIDVMYTGKITDLANSLTTCFEKDEALKGFKPDLGNNRVLFKK